MSTNPVQEERPAKAPKRKPLIPPEDSFWQRYSPHHEAPLSGLTSLAVHLLAIPLMLLVGWLLIKLGLGEDSKPLPVDAVQLLGGGGGSPRGTDKSGSEPGTEPQKDAERGDPKDKSAEPPPSQPEDRKPLEPARAQAMLSEFSNDDTVKRWVNQPTQAFEALSHREADARQRIRKAVNPGVGRGGSGTDGGKDTGKDTGTGAATGAGKASLNQREKRILRWGMTFNTRNGADYANQLQGLGAIVAIPMEDGKRYQVVRDLKQRPVQLDEKNISEINRIFWVDDVKDSVFSLIHNGLGMKKIPPFFVAFFPEELEKRLLVLELDYQQQKTGQQNEDVIHETKFNVIHMGGDKYDVKVVGQKYIK